MPLQSGNGEAKGHVEIMTVIGRFKSFVGRQRELAWLRDRYAAALRGELQVAMVSGESGAGKTFLLGHFAALAGASEAETLRGGASDAEAMPPYLPFLEALGQHIQSTPVDDLRSQVGVHAGTLAQVLPELSLRIGELPASYPLPPEQARLRLHESVGAFLAAASFTRPVILILDDLQWADAASLDLLCHMAGHQFGARLLVLGAYRDDESTASPAFQRALVELSRLRVLATLSIGPLSEQEIDALAAVYLGGPLHPRTAALLSRRSEGNAFFAEELLRGWMEADALEQGSGHWVLKDLEGHHLPPTVVAAIQQRVGRLPALTMDHLRTAAVVGRIFDSEFLAQVEGQDAEALDEQLQEAVRAGLITLGIDGSYIFRHDTVREVLYAEVSPVRRRRLHGFIGHALEARGQVEGGHRTVDLAFHFSRSGDRQRGADYSRKAGEWVLSAHAPEEAFFLFRAARDQLDAGDSRRGEVLLDMGRAASLANMEKDAVAAFEAAQSHYQRMRDRESAARAAHYLGHAWWRQEAIVEAQAAFEAGIAALEDRPGAVLAQLLVDLAGLIGISKHDYERAVDYARRAVDLARTQADSRLLAAAIRALGSLLVRNNNLDAGIPLMEEALDVATETGDPAEATECCAFLTVAYFWRASFRRSREIAALRLEFARRCYDPYQLRHAYSWLAVIEAVQGRLADAEGFLAEAESIVERLSSPEPRAYLSFVQGVLSYSRGDYVAADEYLEKGIRLFRDAGPGSLVWYLGWHCLIQAIRGNRTHARATMDELEALLATLPEGTMPTGEPLAQLTMTSLVLGDIERAARYYPRLASFEGQFQDFLVDRLLGEVELLQGNWQKAQRHLDAAEATARREELAHELALVLQAQAGLALSTDGRRGKSRAQEQLGEARKLYEHMGNQSEAKRIDAKLRGPARPGRRPVLPAGLSAREVEVLRLVAAGKSNRDIAAELVISEKTVEHHLAHIYGKIGAESRVAAAAFAIREGLG